MLRRSIAAAAWLRPYGCHDPSCLPKSASCRRFYDHRLTRLQHRLVATLQALQSDVVAPHPILAAFAGLAVLQAVGAHVAVARQNGAVHPLQEADTAERAIARAPFAPAARA